jgi:probable HAF family extracellular repeat protein
LYRFLAIAVLLDVKDIPQVGPLQWGWISQLDLPAESGNVDLGGASGTAATGVNDMDQIVGSYQDASGNTHGFLLSNGTYTTIDDPDATIDTIAHGINDAGHIVGEFSNTPSAKARRWLNVPGSIPVLPCVHKRHRASIAWMLQDRPASTPAHA